MAEEKKIPGLLDLMFGEAAEAAQRGASERLKRWCEAFDEWLAERRRSYGPDTIKQSVLAWRRLLHQCRKMPWELRAVDIEALATWMQEKGYSPNTIYASQGNLINFYEWCRERQIDPECEAGFNPGEGVHRIKVRRYEQARVLSREEVEALLGLMKRDTSPLGRRDSAFILIRLRLGAPLSNLQQLKWGQIEQDREGTLIRWRPEAEPVPLPIDAWEAIQDALEAGGRLETMEASNYIFAPLANPGVDTGEHAEDWQAGKPLSTSQLLANLKLYGRLAGIPEEKLTLMALRSTATRLRLDEGANLEEMRAFLDCREEGRFTRYRLGKLPRMPEDGDCFGKDHLAMTQGRRQDTGEEGRLLRYARNDTGEGDLLRGARNDTGEGGLLRGARNDISCARNDISCTRNDISCTRKETELPDRRPKPFQPGEGVTHGFYARSQPPEAVAAVLAENIRGIEEQIVGLRILARGMLERQERARDKQEIARLAESYFLAAFRLGELIKMEKELVGEGEDGPEEFLRILLQSEIEEEGEEAVLAQVRAEAMGSEPELETAARRVVEEIAALRYVLRNVFRLALEAEETREHIRLAEIYSSGCMRLVRLLRIEGIDSDRLSRYIGETIRQVHEEVLREFGRITDEG